MSDRIEQLEETVRLLSAEIAQLREELGRVTRVRGELKDTEARQATKPPPKPRRLSRERLRAAAPQVEGVVGRYGTTALAALLIVMAAGAFLRWAAENFSLGPLTRVMAGAAAAAVVATVGWRFRVRGARPFGNTLLGLALALVHVDAWGAGPYLHLIGPGVALALAGLASGALAALAYGSEEQPLFAVGLGGALLAPFVTASGEPRVIALLVYGWVVIASGCWALRGRPWKVASRMMIAGALIYAFAAFWGNAAEGPWWLRDAAPSFALSLTWSAMAASRATHRRELPRAFLVVLLLTLLALATTHDPAREVIVLAFLGTLTMYAMAHVPRAASNHPLLDAAALPLLALGTALLALGYTAYSLRGSGVALAWAAASVLAAATRRVERVAHLLVTGTATALVVLLALPDEPGLSVALLSVHAVLFALVMRRERASLLTLPAVLSLVVGSTWAYRLLIARPIYGYPAFWTPASAVALAAVAGWLVFGHIAARVSWADMRATPPSIRALVASSGAIAALGWGYEELANFRSPEVSTSILALYFAACGVATILVGRRLDLAGARQAGLGLAVYAAFKAVVQVSSLPAVGLRITSYLLVGCFLLAVAYWYRDRLVATQ